MSDISQLLNTTLLEFYPLPILYSFCFKYRLENKWRIYHCSCKLIETQDEWRHACVFITSSDTVHSYVAVCWQRQIIWNIKAISRSSLSLVWGGFKETDGEYKIIWMPFSWPTFKPCISVIKVFIKYSTCCMFIGTVVPCKLLVSLYYLCRVSFVFCHWSGRDEPLVTSRPPLASKHYTLVARAKLLAGL